jgi:hypothetical protein
MQGRNTVKVDYLVVTAPLTSLTAEEDNHFAALSIDGEYRKLYGYRGFLKDNIFIGDNGDRLLIQATGASADSALSLVNHQWQGLSVARIDLQITVLVADADSIIRGSTPPISYKAVRMINLGERGSTLYVGAPKSRCRARIYNKTAESGEQRTDGQERLRIELQLRDSYADRALVNLKAGTGDMFFRYYISRMTDHYITNLVDKAFANSNMLSMIETSSQKSDDTRKEWLEHSVMPALVKLAVYDREYFVKFVERLKEMLD